GTHVAMSEILLADGPLFVELCYRRLLARAPEPQEIAHWAGLMDHGTSKEEVLCWMMYSSEVWSRCPALSTQALARVLLRIALRRYLGALPRQCWWLSSRLAALPRLLQRCLRRGTYLLGSIARRRETAGSQPATDESFRPPRLLRFEERRVMGPGPERLAG